MTNRIVKPVDHPDRAASLPIHGKPPVKVPAHKQNAHMKTSPSAPHSATSSNDGAGPAKVSTVATASAPIVSDRLGALNRLVRRPGWVAFGEHLSDFIHKRLGMTVGEFADAVECERTLLSKVVSGYIGIPEYALTGTLFKGGREFPRTRWSAALNLRPAEAKFFEERAWLSLAPDPVIARVLRLEDEAARLKARASYTAAKATTVMKRYAPRC